MQLAQAKTIAEGLVEAFKPYCRRVQIAGSIRRERPEVKDIEIVAVPHMRFGEDLFGNPGEPYSVLDDALLKMLQAGWGEQKKVETAISRSGSRESKSFSICSQSFLRRSGV